jgi:hypothetical protein
MRQTYCDHDRSSYDQKTGHIVTFFSQIGKERLSGLWVSLSLASLTCAWIIAFFLLEELSL